MSEPLATGSSLDQPRAFSPLRHCFLIRGAEPRVGGMSIKSITSRTSPARVVGIRSAPAQWLKIDAFMTSSPPVGLRTADRKAPCHQTALGGFEITIEVLVLVETVVQRKMLQKQAGCFDPAAGSRLPSSIGRRRRVRGVLKGSRAIPGLFVVSIWKLLLFAVLIPYSSNGRFINVRTAQCGDVTNQAVRYQARVDRTQFAARDGLPVSGADEGSTGSTGRRLSSSTENHPDSRLLLARS